MSKIGNAPIKIPENVHVEMSKNAVLVKGPEGELIVKVPVNIFVKKEDSILNIERKNDQKKLKALHGLTRALLANAVHGVITPFTKSLKIVGTGYRVKLQGVDLIFDVGYSHSVVFNAVEKITYTVKGTNQIEVKGIDKQKVGEIAFQIRCIRKPDPYKGKGIRYEDEVIKLKPGKKAKTGA